MQIQRIQSLYLFLAAILMAVTLFMPVLEFQNVTDPDELLVIKPVGELALLIPMALTALMIFIDIFLYTDLRLQRRVLIFSMLFTILDVALIVFMVFNGAVDFAGSISWWSYVLIAILALEMLAKRGIEHDRDLLESANRLR